MVLPTSSCSILLHPLSLWVFYLIPDIWARSRTAPARYGSERRFVYDSLRHVGDRRFPRKGGEHREDCRTSYLRANLKCPAKCSASELPLEIQLPRHHTQAFSQSLIIGAAAKEILRSLLEASQYKVYPFGYESSLSSLKMHIWDSHLQDSNAVERVRSMPDYVAYPVNVAQHVPPVFEFNSGSRSRPPELAFAFALLSPFMNVSILSHA